MMAWGCLRPPSKNGMNCGTYATLFGGKLSSLSISVLLKFLRIGIPYSSYMDVAQNHSERCNSAQPGYSYNYCAFAAPVPDHDASFLYSIAVKELYLSVFSGHFLNAFKYLASIIWLWWGGKTAVQCTLYRKLVQWHTDSYASALY